MIIVALLAIGFGAGLAGSLLGLGGGLIIVPALALLLDIPIHQAIAASLVGAVATSSGAAPSNLERGFVNVKLSTVFEVFTIAGAIGGGLAGTMIDGSLLGRIFGVTLVLMSILMFRRPTERPRGSRAASPSRYEARYHDEAEAGEVSYTPGKLPQGMGISTGAGFLSGLLGIGGGIVQVPMLTLLNGLPMKAATSTSNYMLGATALAGALVWYGNGFLDPLVAAGVVAGVVAGSRLGAAINRRVRSNALRVVFAVVMILVGLRMVLA